MGRNKIKIEKKADSQQQLATYNKRRNGIAKKGHELSILCDIRLLLLSKSPKGKINLVLGSNSNFEDVIHKYCNLSPEERHEGRLETIEVLKKAFKGEPDHEVDVQQLMNHGLSGNSQIQEIPESFHGSLVNIDNIPMISSIGELSQMQYALENLINLNRQKKMSMLEERARAFQQVAMNHPGPEDGNLMNQGTNLIQSNLYLTDSNMGPTGNSITVSDPPMEAPELARNSDPSMAALPKLDEEVVFSVEDLLNLADECILDN